MVSKRDGYINCWFYCINLNLRNCKRIVLDYWTLEGLVVIVFPTNNGSSNEIFTVSKRIYNFGSFNVH